MDGTTIIGRVVQILPRGGLVESEGRLIRCELRGVRRLSPRENRHPVAVGDEVTVSTSGNEEGVIEEIADRRTVFSRRSPGEETEHAIAANADAVLAIFSTEKTLFRPGLADRILAGAVFGGMGGMICLNKIDLKPNRDQIPVMEGFRKTGFEVFLVSASTGAGIDELAARLSGRTVVFVGHSGVGKSSILSRLCSDPLVRVGALSDKTGRGRHTTTSPRLFHAGNSATIIDTPGIREFEPFGVTQQNLWSCYPEMQGPGASCKYPSCLHTVEPGCAVIAALEEGRIDEGRYDRYVRLLNSIG